MFLSLLADALSDLIVIALLRTSSMEIKEVCAEAFYNMLCHRDSRLKLLATDIWWAISRLSHHDSNRIQTVCANVLYDLSVGAEYTEALRHHHVLSFVRDLTSRAMHGHASLSDDFLTICQKVT